MTSTVDSQVSLELDGAPEDADGAPLDALLAALERLEEAIAREAAALAATDSATLLDAVDDKRRALAAVETLIRQPSLAALLAGGDGRETSALTQSPTWPQVVAKLAACRTANDAVGGVLAAARRSTEASLKWLGVAADDDTYGHTGAGRGPAPRDLAVC